MRGIETGNEQQEVVFFLLEDSEEVFFTETGRPLWDGLGDFLPVLPFFSLLFIYAVVWSLFCDVDVMWM